MGPPVVMPAAVPPSLPAALAEGCKNYMAGRAHGRPWRREMTRICAVAAAGEPDELAVRGHAALAAGADLVELRLDHLRPLTPATLESALAAARGRGLMAAGRLVLSLRAKRDG